MNNKIVIYELLNEVGLPVYVGSTTKRECERITGCRRPSIMMVINGKIKSYKGYTFRRAYA